MASEIPVTGASLQGLKLGQAPGIDVINLMALRRMPLWFGEPLSRQIEDARVYDQHRETSEYGANILRRKYWPTLGTIMRWANWDEGNPETDYVGSNAPIVFLERTAETYLSEGRDIEPITELLHGVTAARESFLGRLAVPSERQNELALYATVFGLDRTAKNSVDTGMRTGAKSTNILRRLAKYRER